MNEELTSTLTSDTTPENPADEQPLPGSESATEQPIEDSPTSGGENSAADDSTEGDFDAAKFEADYGLPEGSLKGATDVQSAMDLIRDYTDKTLIAGMDYAGQSPDAPEPPKSKAGETQTTAEPTDYEKLRAELNEIKGALQQQTQAAQQHQIQELDRRIMAEVDVWNSSKYGTSKARTFHQTKAIRDLRGMLQTHVAGLAATGQPIPEVETLLRRVRVFDGDVPKPPQPKMSAPVGTPGVAGQRTSNDPANIHELYMRNRT